MWSRWDRHIATLVLKARVVSGTFWNGRYKPEPFQAWIYPCNLPTSSAISRELLSYFSTCSGWKWLKGGGKWKSCFRDAKWCLGASWGFEGVNTNVAIMFPWPNAGLMLDRRRRRRANINPELGLWNVCPGQDTIESMLLIIKGHHSISGRGGGGAGVFEFTNYFFHSLSHSIPHAKYLFHFVRGDKCINIYFLGRPTREHLGIQS